MTGWRVLWIFVAFFGVVVAVDSWMMIRAFHTYPGEVSATPYEDGLSVNKDLARQQTQADLGWRTSLQLAGSGGLQLTVRDRAGAAVLFSRIQAHIERPATLQGARDVRFAPVAPGVYRADAGLSGAWDVTIHALDSAGHRFELEQRVVAP